jgi:TRAP-type C4-dicarboxylate transport system permease small subunit
MDKLIQGIVRADDWVLKATLVLCGALLAVMVAIAAAGVVCRFVLHASLSWSEEFDAYLFVWLTCLGAAAGVKLRAHPEVRALADRMPAFAQKVIADLTDGAVVALGIILVVYGGEMISMMGTETAASMPISMTYPYLAIPVGGALLIFHSLVRILVAHAAPGAAREATPILHGLSEHL